MPSMKVIFTSSSQISLRVNFLFLALHFTGIRQHRLFQEPLSSQARVSVGFTDILSVLESGGAGILNMQHPTTNIQAPGKLQEPGSKELQPGNEARLCSSRILEVGLLDLLWSLDVGRWMLGMSAAPSPQKPIVSH